MGSNPIEDVETVEGRLLKVDRRKNWQTHWVLPSTSNHRTGAPTTGGNVFHPCSGPAIRAITSTEGNEPHGWQGQSTDENQEMAAGASRSGERSRQSLMRRFIDHQHPAARYAIRQSGEVQTFVTLWVRLPLVPSSSHSGGSPPSRERIPLAKYSRSRTKKRRLGIGVPKWL